MAEIIPVDGNIGGSGTHAITVALSSRLSFPTTKNRLVSSTVGLKGTTGLSDSPPLLTTSTSIKIAKTVDHPIPVSTTGISSWVPSATPTIPIQSASSTNIPGDTDTESSGALGLGIVTAVVIGAIIVILLPIIILCLRRRHTIDCFQQTRWWKQRRRPSRVYGASPFSSGTEHSIPTPTPQWATGSHVYRPGDPPILPEEEELYSNTLKSKLALSIEQIRMTSLSAASTVSLESTQRPSPMHEAGSQPSLPLFTRPEDSSDLILPSLSPLPASPRIRTISLRTVCLSNYPPIPPLPTSPPPPPPFPRVRGADLYVFVVADPLNDPLGSSS